MLDKRTSMIAQIAAATAANALPALRAVISEALDTELSKDEINTIIELAQEIQRQPVSHTQQLANQLLREPKKKSSDSHSAGCNCGCHS